jgi:hypothetical protein
MKGANRLELATGFLQLDTLTDNLDDIGAGDEIIDETLRNQAAHVVLNGRSTQTGLS